MVVGLCAFMLVCCSVVCVMGCLWWLVAYVPYGWRVVVWCVFMCLCVCLLDEMAAVAFSSLINAV